MKKKKIEQVPFIGLDKTIRKKGILYVGITKIKKIDGKMHLFLEVYRNRAKDKDKPVIRYVADKKDWAIYDTRLESWSHRKIKSHDWSDGLIWYDALPLDHSIYNRQTKSKINVLASDDDLKRIKKFFDGLTPYTSIYDQWYDIVARYEDHCNWKKRVRASQLRNERLNARTNAIEELDEKAIGEYADRILLGRKHYIYYVKKGARASIACSHCGWVTTGRYKAGDTYESQFENFVEEPREGTKAICPRCKEKGIYKAAGQSDEVKHTDLEKCIIDYFRDRKDMLNRTLSLICADKKKEAQECMNPSGNATHKKGLCFLFMYEYERGVKYKLLTEPAPVSISWDDFLTSIYEIYIKLPFPYAEGDEPDYYSEFYGNPVATSQQEIPEVEAPQVEKSEENTGIDECQHSEHEKMTQPEPVAEIENAENKPSEEMPEGETPVNDTAEADSEKTENPEERINTEKEEPENAESQETSRAEPVATSQQEIPEVEAHQEEKSEGNNDFEESINSEHEETSRAEPVATSQQTITNQAAFSNAKDALRRINEAMEEGKYQRAIDMADAFIMHLEMAIR